MARRCGRASAGISVVITAVGINTAPNTPTTRNRGIMVVGAIRSVGALSLGEFEAGFLASRCKEFVVGQEDLSIRVGSMLAL